MNNDRVIVGLLGSGGREHALYDALLQSHQVQKVLCMPGNGGMPRDACREVDISSFSAVLDVCRQESITFLVVGPELPLVNNIVGYFRDCAPDIKVFGPSAMAAELEGSKIFCKTRCTRWGIKTARFDFAGSYKVAELAIKRDGFRIVKADGLCSGKGVTVAETEEELLEAVHQLLVEKSQGKAGAQVVLEERLIGRECSVMAFCDGINAVLMPPARDYKRAHDGNIGPNTGGMGAYSPVPDVSDELLATIKRDIIDKLMYGMRKEGRPYHGVIYAGIMITEGDVPYLLEVNCRFGDPETEVVLPALISDLFGVMRACTEENGLSNISPLVWDGVARVDVVMATREYPASSSDKSVILGLKRAQVTGARVYHAGTKRLENDMVQVNGGRVLNVVGRGHTTADARRNTYAAIKKIHFPSRYRRDIAKGM